MKKMTTGQIFRLFIEQDSETIIRKTNMRHHCIKNNLDYTICQDKWLIDCENFINSICAKKFTESIKLPRLRTKITAQREWNKTHRTKIKHHIIDVICDNNRVFVYKHGRHNIINYDELEQELIKELKKRNKY